MDEHPKEVGDVGVCIEPAFGSSLLVKHTSLFGVLLVFIWPLVVSSLQSLDMAGNQLTSIPSGLPESLEYLYLQNNKITMISENAFESTPKIKGIYLR